MPKQERRGAMNEEILLKSLNTFTPDDLLEIGSIADSLFARLLRPFMQNRIEHQFSVRSTIRHAMRTSQILPQYDRVQKIRRKSKLVIAMSLSGVDRCF